MTAVLLTAMFAVPFAAAVLLADWADRRIDRARDLAEQLALTEERHDLEREWFTDPPLAPLREQRPR